MDLRIGGVVGLICACGGDGAGTVATSGAAETTSAASEATGEAPTSSAASDETNAATDPSSETAASSTGDTPGGPGPFVLYDGPPAGAIVPDWDPADPRPLLVAQLGFGPAWTMAYAEIHPDGTITSATERIVVWGFEPIAPVLDAAVGELLPNHDPAAPPPAIALGTGPTLAGAWITMTPGLWLDANGSVGPGGKIDRVIVWDAAEGMTPPTQIYAGPHDGSFVFPDWDEQTPSPMIVWADSVVAGQWLEIPFAVFADGSVEPSPDYDVRVFAW